MTASSLSAAGGVAARSGRPTSSRSWLPRAWAAGDWPAVSLQALPVSRLGILAEIAAGGGGEAAYGAHGPGSRSQRPAPEHPYAAFAVADRTQRGVGLEPFQVGLGVDDGVQ